MEMRLCMGTISLKPVQEVSPLANGRGVFAD